MGNVPVRMTPKKPAEIIGEPLRPSQHQSEVTRAMTGVDLDLHLCAVCCTNRGVGDHHLVWRSHGGEDGPTLPVCPRCHGLVHANEWMLRIEKDGLAIYDREGTQIWRLKRWPEQVHEPGYFVQLLDGVTEATTFMTEIAPALLPWQATEVFRALSDAQAGGWRAQARLIGEFFEYRMPHLDGPEKIKALCEMFGCRRSSIYNYVSVASAFKDSPALEATPLSLGYVIEAAKTADPIAWLDHAQERKEQHPAYSRSDLRAEIIQQQARVRTVASDSAEPAMGRVWAKCSGCGKADWMQRLPVGNDGKPVEIGGHEEAE